MEKANVIVIEGIDGAGKKTQSDLLYSKLKNITNKQVFMQSFPNYESESSFGVRHHLRRDGIINCQNKPYIVAASFALDRALTIYDKFNPEIYNTIKNGGIVIFDRYTTSNLLHTATMLDTVKEIDEFIDVVTHLEYDTLQIPKPTKVLFLDIHPDISLCNIKKRGNTTDINETKEHLYKVYERSQYVIEKMGWERINCVESLKKKTMYSPLEIHLKMSRSILSIK